MKSLLTPWRYSYLVQEKTKGQCIFYEALARADSSDSLLVYRGRYNFVILNLYPYANGHLMVVPNTHHSSPSASSSGERAELIDIASTCEAALREIYNADGINMGMNIGRAAGAGIESHYHLHVVPRWEGDTNFMAVTAETRIIPEEFPQTRTRLRAQLLARLGPEPTSSDA